MGVLLRNIPEGPLELPFSLRTGREEAGKHFWFSRCWHLIYAAFLASLPFMQHWLDQRPNLGLHLADVIRPCQGHGISRVPFCVRRYTDLDTS